MRRTTGGGGGTDSSVSDEEGDDDVSESETQTEKCRAVRRGAGWDLHRWRREVGLPFTNACSEGAETIVSDGERGMTGGVVTGVVMDRDRGSGMGRRRCHRCSGTSLLLNSRKLGRVGRRVVVEYSEDEEVEVVTPPTGTGPNGSQTPSATSLPAAPPFGSPERVPTSGVPKTMDSVIGGAMLSLSPPSDPSTTLA